MTDIPVKDVIDNYKKLHKENKLDNLCITEMNRLIYNEEHNTNYNYGEYVAFIKEGRLNN